MSSLNQNRSIIIFADIRPDAVKLGMIATPDIMEAVCEKLAEYQAQNIVADPVMVATSGSSLMDRGYSHSQSSCRKTKLFPYSDRVNHLLYLPKS